jgi:hypothetical protein
MDEDLDSLAQRYGLRRNIKLGERLGFGIHGTVFAAEDNTKPGFFAVKFHREEMTIVRSPFLLDFTDALLDEAPDFREDVLRQWEEDKAEIFGERWPEVTRILAALQAFDVYLLDINPRNISFPEETR